MSDGTVDRFALFRRVDLLVLLGALVTLFIALGSEPWWTLTGTATSKLLNIQVSPFYLHINAVGLPPTMAAANNLGFFTRVLLILGSLAMLAASLSPTSWWRNLAVYTGLSSLAELYFSFLMMYYWAQSAFIQAYGSVPLYSGTAILPGRILGLDLTYYSGPLVTAAFAFPFYLGFLCFGSVMGRGIIRFVQERALKVLAALLPGGGVHDVYLTPPYHSVWFSSVDKEFNPMITDPDRMNDDELLVSFQKLYDTVEPGGTLSIVLPAWATGVGDRFQRLLPNTGFTLEEGGVIHRTPGKAENELRFRKPISETQQESNEAAGLKEAISIQPPVQPPSLGETAVETVVPPVLEISEEPSWVPAKLSRVEKTILKTAVEVIAQHQEPVPYRELLNQVYMDMVDKKIDFDSARQIEATLVNHNGREVLLIEEADETNDRIVRKWWLGEQKIAPEKKRRIPLVGRISHSKPKLPSVRFPFRKSERPRYLDRVASDEDQESG